MRAIKTSELIPLLNWCGEYQKYGPRRWPVFHRFGIGFYQVGQGMRWDGSLDVAHQSFIAACIHWMCIAEVLRLKRFPVLLPKDLQEVDVRFLGWEQFLRTISAAQQQIFYREASLENGEKSFRSSRYDSDIFCRLLVTSIEQSIALVPREKIPEHVFNETHIMTGRL